MDHTKVEYLMFFFFSPGDAKFVSVTYRLFKLPEKPSEYATVTYNGGIEGFEEEFSFDHGIVFKVTINV